MGCVAVHPCHLVLCFPNCVPEPLHTISFLIRWGSPLLRAIVGTLRPFLFPFLVKRTVVGVGGRFSLPSEHFPIITGCIQACAKRSLWSILLKDAINPFVFPCPWTCAAFSPQRILLPSTFFSSERPNPHPHPFSCRCSHSTPFPPSSRPFFSLLTTFRGSQVWVLNFLDWREMGGVFCPPPPQCAAFLVSPCRSTATCP